MRRHRLQTLMSLALLSACFVVACSRGAGSPPLSAPRHWLAQQLAVSADEIRLVLADERNWSDSCLGLGGPAESCLAVVTPGWQFILEANGELFEVRADRFGNELRSPQIAPDPSLRPGAPAGAS